MQEDVETSAPSQAAHFWPSMTQKGGLMVEHDVCFKSLNFHGTRQSNDGLALSRATIKSLRERCARQRGAPPLPSSFCRSGACMEPRQSARIINDGNFPQQPTRRVAASQGSSRASNTGYAYILAHRDTVLTRTSKGPYSRGERGGGVTEVVARFPFP